MKKPSITSEGQVIGTRFFPKDYEAIEKFCRLRGMTIAGMLRWLTLEFMASERCAKMTQEAISYNASMKQYRSRGNE